MARADEGNRGIRGIRGKQSRSAIPVWDWPTLGRPHSWRLHPHRYNHGREETTPALVSSREVTFLSGTPERRRISTAPPRPEQGRKSGDQSCQAARQPGGLPDGSRGSPRGGDPRSRVGRSLHPGTGCQKPASGRSSWLLASLRDAETYHPWTGGLATLRPPATVFHPSGMNLRCPNRVPSLLPWRWYWRDTPGVRGLIREACAFTEALQVGPFSTGLPRPHGTSGRRDRSLVGSGRC